MDTQRISRPSPQDKPYALHTPTWRTTPPRCLTCAQPIRTLEEWLNSECLGAPAREEAA
jgi:hypothetical protein